MRLVGSLIESRGTSRGNKVMVSALKRLISSDMYYVNEILQQCCMEYILVRVSGVGSTDTTDVKDAWSSVSKPLVGCTMASSWRP